MKKIILFIIFSILVSYSFGQVYTLSGYVENENTHERISGAVLRLKNNKIVCVANDFGFYSLSYNFKDTTKIIISYVGYVSQEIQYKELSCLPVVLLKESADIEEVIVTANQFKTEKRNEVSTFELIPTKLKYLPAIGGEIDIMKIFQLLPSVKSGNEGSSEIFVRGGGPDQNLILLDDMPLYYVNHLGGFVSIFNNDALNSVKLISGGFPAKYGNRLSSVLDIRMKEGNLMEYHGNLTLGLISSKFAIEGPIIKGKTSFLISGRRFMYDLIMKPISKTLLDGLSTGYSFYDINAKVNHKFSENNRVYLSIYNGNDITKYLFKLKDSKTDKALTEMSWGNLLTGMRWNHIFNKKLFSNLITYYSKYKNQTVSSGMFDGNEYYNIFYSEINDVSLKYDFEYFINHNYKLMFGTNSVIHKFIPDVKQFQKNDNSNQIDEYMAFDNALYADSEMKFTDFFNGVFGIRLTDYYIEEKHFFSLEPRIILNFMVADILSIKPAYTYMQQNIHLLSSSGVGMTKEIWVPATIKAIPETATQYSLSFSSSMNTEQYEISSELYYKKMNNLITYKEGVSYYSGNSDWQNKIETNGKGKSYGVEFMFQKTQGNFYGWVSYTLSKTTQSFENINNGIIFPYKYDRTHDFKIVLTYEVNKRQTVSASWVYSTGNAITLPIAKYNTINDANFSPFEEFRNFSYNDEIYIYPERNSMRMKDYHRLDISMNFHKIKKNTKRVFSVSIYNVYSRQNPYFYYLSYSPIYDNRGNVLKYSNPKIKQVSYFPFIPSLSYSIDF